MTLQVTNLNEVNLDGVNANISTWGNSVKTHITAWGSSIISKVSATGGGGMTASTVMVYCKSTVNYQNNSFYSMTISAPAITGKTCVGVVFAAPAGGTHFRAYNHTTINNDHITLGPVAILDKSQLVIHNCCISTLTSSRASSIPFGGATFLYV